MNTDHPSAGTREPRDPYTSAHHHAASTAAPAPCRLAAAGTCPVSDLCPTKPDAFHQLFQGPTVLRRVIHRGHALYRAGDTLVNLYELYAGSVKLRSTSRTGLEQIVSFPMAGSLLGLDGIEKGTYECDAIALEDSLVCVLPLSELVSRSGSDAAAALSLNRAIAHETSHYRQLLMAMACLNSEERVAHFLVEISEKMAVNGYSPREFMLKMTREDIARHLGMKLETVSRIFTHLRATHVLDVRRRHIRIRSPEALRSIGTTH